MNLDWGAAATIVAAIVGLFAGGVPSFRRIKENLSPTAKYRELRLLRSREAKVKEMNAASSDTIKESFASFINEDDCKIEQMKYARELNNYRSNFKLNEESAPSPDASLYEFSVTLILSLVFLFGLSVTFDWLKDSHISIFIIAILVFLALLFIVWALLIQGIKNYFWKATVKDGFGSFLMPFYATPKTPPMTQQDFKRALESFDNVYANKRIVSLKKASSRILIVEGIALIVAALVDAFTSGFGRVINTIVYIVCFAFLVLLLLAFFCCYLSYWFESRKLIYAEKKKYSWYNTLIDKNDINTKKNKLSTIIDKIGLWLGKKIGR